MSQQAPQWQWDSSSRRWYVYDRKSSHRIYEDGERRLATSETRADSLSSRSRTIPDLSAPADRRTTYGRSNASRPSASRREDSINASQARQHGTATSRPDPTTLADRVAREFASVTLRNDSMLPPSNKERDSRTSQSQQPADAPQPLRSQRATGTVSTSSRADSATALQSRNHLATTENQPTSGSTSHDREARIQAAIARLMARDYSASQAQEAVRIQLNAIASRDLDSSDTDGEDSSSDGSEDSRTPQAAQRSGPGTTRTDSRVTRARRQAYPPRSDSRPHTARSSTTNATSALEVPNASSKSGSATDQIRSQTRTTLQSPSTLQSDPRQVPPESWTEAAVRAVMQQGYTREQAVQYLTTSAARARSGQQQSVIRTSPLAEGSKSQDVLGAPAGGRAIEPPPQTQRTPGVEQNEQSEVKLQAVPFPPGQVTDRDTKIYTTVDPSSGYRCSIEIGKAKAITSRSLQEQRVMVRQVILYSAVDRQSSGPSASSGMQGTASGTANNGNASTSPNTSPPIGAAPESLSTKISSIQASTSARTQRSSRDWKKGKVVQCYYVEPDSQSSTVVTTLNGLSRIPLRCFVLVAEGRGCSAGLPITTYRGRGVPANQRSRHCIIYTGERAPAPLDEEKPTRENPEELRRPPIQVEPYYRDWKLDPLSRLNYAEPAQLNWDGGDITVVGQVAEDLMPSVVSHYEAIRRSIWGR